jgi:hypothetical protein
VKAAAGVRKVVGDGMVTKAVHMNQGDLAGGREPAWTRSGSPPLAQCLLCPTMGCSLLPQPMRRPANPRGGKTTDWRAVCGKSARTVRRGEEPGQPALPTPIRHAAFAEALIWKWNYLSVKPARFARRWGSRISG